LLRRYAPRNDSYRDRFEFFHTFSGQKLGVSRKAAKRAKRINGIGILNLKNTKVPAFLGDFAALRDNAFGFACQYLNQNQFFVFAFLRVLRAFAVKGFVIFSRTQK